MAQVKVFYDEVGNTLTVWFGNPQDEYVSEETGDEVILMKDKAGKVIGFEKLNFSIAKPKHLQVAFETVAASKHGLTQGQPPISSGSLKPRAEITEIVRGMSGPDLERIGRHPWFATRAKNLSEGQTCKSGHTLPHQSTMTKFSKLMGRKLATCDLKDSRGKSRAKTCMTF